MLPTPNFILPKIEVWLKMMEPDTSIDANQSSTTRCSKGDFFYFTKIFKKFE
jgi:hypothetical protein